MAKLKNALVTGGANGIGRAIVEHFARRDYRVVFTDKDAGHGQWWEARLRRARLKADFLPADLAEENSLKAMSAKARKIFKGGLDALVNNAAIGSGGDLFTRPKGEWDRVLAVNLTAPYLLAGEFALLMKPGSGIVNIASTRALMSEAGTEPYSASKGGLLALTHSLALSLAGRKIRVNAILPGWIETSAWQGKHPKAAKLKPRDHAQHPCGRVGKPEDIAKACFFLADPDTSGFMTGAHMVVDGGMTVKMIYD